MDKSGGKLKLEEWRKALKKRVRGLKHIKVKTWILLLVLVPLLFIDATLLRQNHIKMTELRDAVMTADDENDDAKIAETLIELKEFVFSNIVVNVVEDNGEQRLTFGTGPFYLEHQYLRAAEAALAAAEAALAGDANPNGNVYGMAGDTCKALALANGWTWDNANFINCMMTEINKYPSAAEIQDTIIAALPSTELYRHNYASPIWTPSFVGWLILLTLIIIVVIIIRMIIWVVLRLSLLFI
ncbi:MAG: hypothetical protein Q4A36_01665 [Candidatus Saccharibacteria bacterium]|nr:hypothetical protein [Candidatus Saccharibacteria bacterium]